MINQYDKISSAQYSPLSTQEMWAPLQHMREQHDKLEADLSSQDQLGTASLLGLNPDVDKDAIAIKQSYLNETRQAANDLATKGFIDSGRRSNLLKIKKDYNEKVVPLQNALLQRQQRSEEWRKVSMDSNNIVSQDPGLVALSKIIGDPKAIDYKVVSGAQMAADVSAEAQQFADRLLSSKNISKVKNMAAYQYLYDIKHGADPALVLNAMKNNPNTYKDKESKQLYDQMIGIVNSTVDRYKVKDVVGDNQSEYDRAWSIAAKGLSSAIGKSDMQLIHDTYSESQDKKGQQTPEEKLLFGDSGSVISPEGRAIEMDLMLGIDPLFSNDGRIQMYSSKTLPGVNSLNPAISPTGGTWYKHEPGDKSELTGKERIDAANAKQIAINNMINQYRNANGIPTSGKGAMTQKQIWNRMRYDSKERQNFLNMTTHSLIPIEDAVTSNVILNKAFSTSSATSRFAILDNNFSKDVKTDTSLNDVLKRTDLTRDQVVNYLKNNKVKMQIDNNTGMYTVTVPSKMINTGNGNSKVWEAAPGSKDIVIEFNFDDEHKSRTYAIEQIRDAQLTGKKTPVKITGALEAVNKNGKLLYATQVYDNNDGMMYTGYYLDKNGNELIGKEPLTVSDRDGNVEHLSGNTRRSILVNLIKNGIIEQYSRAQDQTDAIPNTEW